MKFENTKVFKNPNGYNINSLLEDGTVWLNDDLGVYDWFKKHDDNVNHTDMGACGLDKGLIRRIKLAKSDEPITIYRTIWADSFDDIEPNNFGIHWTHDVNFASDPNLINENISDELRKGEMKFTFKTTCNSCQINYEASQYSNKTHPLECEVTLREHAILKVVEEVNWCDKYPITSEVNTGTRKNRWVIPFIPK